MTYTVRITGPGIDHTALMTCAEDIEAARKVLDRIERDNFAPTYFQPHAISGECTWCGKRSREHMFGGQCPTSSDEDVR